MLAPTERFSNRVDNYIRYRPSYPAGVIDMLRGECGLTSDSIVADIGSGTGILTELLLECGCRVFGVEPNQEMREAGERRFKSHPRFTSIASAAEATTLRDRSIDLVAAGQAFHWFDQERCRAEFVRLLKPGGWVVLIWNDRRTDATPFLVAYEALLREFATDYKQVSHRNIDRTVLRQFFGGGPKLKTYPYAQHFDYAGLQGRLLSSSYAPEPGQPNHDEILVRLRQIFDTHQQNGCVTFDYDTLVYYDRLA